MKILHILDHSIPLHSGYTFRTRAILGQQRKMGWETAHLTSTKHIAGSSDEETVDGLKFYRTKLPKGLLPKLPLLNQYEVVSTSISETIPWLFSGLAIQSLMIVRFIGHSVMPLP